MVRAERGHAASWDSPGESLQQCLAELRRPRVAAECRVRKAQWPVTQKVLRGAVSSACPAIEACLDAAALEVLQGSGRSSWA